MQALTFNKIKKEQGKSWKLRILFHVVGLSCLSGSVFLQCFVFFDIISHGYFLAVERNLGILSFEITLTVFGTLYFIFLWKRFVTLVWSVKKGGE